MDTNITTNNSCKFNLRFKEYYQKNSSFGILNVTLSMILTLSGICWNSLIIIAVLTKKKLHTSAYILLAYFALAGVIYSGLYCVWSVLKILSMLDLFHKCKLNFAVMLSCQVCTKFLLFIYICLCFDQLLCAYKPYFYSERVYNNKTFYVKIICVGCLALMFVNIPLHLHENKQWFFYYNAVYLILVIIIAVITYTLLYVKLLQINRKSSSVLTVSTTTDKVNVIRRFKQIQIALVCVVNMLATALLLLPFIIKLIMISHSRNSGHDEDKDTAVLIWLCTIPKISLPLCPVFCCMRISAIRKAVRDTLKCKN